MAASLLTGRCLCVPPYRYICAELSNEYELSDSDSDPDSDSDSNSDSNEHEHEQEHRLAAEIAQLLMDKGANQLIKYNNVSPYNAAKQKGHTDVMGVMEVLCITEQCGWRLRCTSGARKGGAGTSV